MGSLAFWGGRSPGHGSLWLGALALVGVLTSGAPSFAEQASSTSESAGPAADFSDAEATDIAEPTEEELAEARLHFSNGVSLLESSPPNYQDAHRQFTLAFEKSGGNWKVLGNLGLCALSLERDGEALEHYRAYLDQGGEEVSEEERAAIEQELLLIRGNMATVNLSSALPDTKVTVTRRGSSVPSQRYELEGKSAELGLRAGELTIVATSGEEQETWKVVLAAEEEVSHTFSFAPPPPPTPVVVAPPAEDPAAEPTGAASPVRTVGFVTAGVGVAALIGGVVAGVISQSQADQAREDGCIDLICQESVEEELDAAAGLAGAANVLMIGGGVLTATGLTLVIVGKKKPTERPTARLELAPRFGGGFAGLSAWGNF